MVDDGVGERRVCHLRRRVHSMYSVCISRYHPRQTQRAAICAQSVLLLLGRGGQGLSGPLRYAAITVPGSLFKHLGPGGGGIPAQPGPASTKGERTEEGEPDAARAGSNGGGGVPS